MTKTALTLQSVVGQSPDLVATTIEEQTALMSITNGAYYGMDKIGSRVWGLIVQPRAISGVVDQLLTEFEVDRPTCEQHVLTFLQKLADADLLSVQ
jgi:hypothetical protein